MSKSLFQGKELTCGHKLFPARVKALHAAKIAREASTRASCSGVCDSAKEAASANQSIVAVRKSLLKVLILLHLAFQMAQGSMAARYFNVPR